MAVRENYSNFKWFEMFEAEDYSSANMHTDGTCSSLSVDTQGYEAVTIMINVGSAAVLDSGSCMRVVLYHADSVTAASYDLVSSSDLIGSDWTVTSDAAASTTAISFGGSMALVSGTIMDFDVATASLASCEGTWCFGYVGKRRYLKLMLESTGSADCGSVALCAMAVATLPANWPVCDPTP